MSGEIKIAAHDLTVYYGTSPALRGLTLEVPARQILGIIGPSRSGKSTFLLCLNRMIDLVPEARVTGSLRLDGRPLYDPGLDIAALRRQVGIVFAVPAPLPRSIYANVTFGPRLKGLRDRARLDSLVEASLRAAFLWDEVKDRLEESALNLSGGQQQRLCLARTLALEPSVLLLDEPCSGLDPISTAKIEQALRELKERITIILVTNNTKQAARVADTTALFLMGELVEHGPTADIFTRPRDKRTEDYVSGRFG